MYKSSRICGVCENLIENTSKHSQKRADSTARRFVREGRACRSCATVTKNTERWANPEERKKQSERFLENNPSKGKPAWNRDIPRDQATKDKIKQTKRQGGGTAGERNPNFGKFKHHNLEQDYKQYRNRVVVLTERVRHNIPGYSESLRGRAGVQGAHQIDHIKPVIDCWYEGWTPEQAADISNLQFIAWGDNLKRRTYKKRI